MSEFKSCLLVNLTFKLEATFLVNHSSNLKVRFTNKHDLNSDIPIASNGHVMLWLQDYSGGLNGSPRVEVNLSNMGRTFCVVSFQAIFSCVKLTVKLSEKMSW